MVENKRGDQGPGKDDFANKGHRMITPSTKPSERPKPQPPEPDKKK